MKQSSPPASPESPPEKTQEPDGPTDPPRLSPGMATLLRGNNPGPKPGLEEKPAKTAVHSSQSRVVRVSLVVADVLLLGLAARLVIKANGHLGAIEIVLCVVALGLGAWLSCLALWRD